MLITIAESPTWTIQDSETHGDATKPADEFVGGFWTERTWIVDGHLSNVSIQYGMDYGQLRMLGLCSQNSQTVQPRTYKVSLRSKGETISDGDMIVGPFMYSAFRTSYMVVLTDITPRKTT